MEFPKIHWDNVKSPSDGIVKYNQQGWAVIRMVFGPGPYDYCTTRIDSLVFACCGCKTMTYMDWMGQPQLWNKEFLEKLIKFLNGLFSGGNIAFVLNAGQRNSYEPMLKLMADFGPVKSSKFYNFNMDNHNYLYVWTFRGKPEDEE